MVTGCFTLADGLLLYGYFVLLVNCGLGLLRLLFRLIVCFESFGFVASDRGVVRYEFGWRFYLVLITF